MAKRTAARTILVFLLTAPVLSGGLFVSARVWADPITEGTKIAETTRPEETNNDIAGLSPDRRPKNAPVISKTSHTPQWRAKALHGIEAPYPDSLKFLDDQGDGYTPFNRPGMTGPYDIRGWHTASTTVSGG